MKKDRNCMMPYPVYPPYQGMNQMMPIPMPYQNYSMGVSDNTFEQQINSLQQQLNNLENRVNNLENMINQNSYNTKYNNTNYQMM